MSKSKCWGAGLWGEGWTWDPLCSAGRGKAQGHELVRLLLSSRFQAAKAPEFFLPHVQREVIVDVRSVWEGYSEPPAAPVSEAGGLLPPSPLCSGLSAPGLLSQGREGGAQGRSPVLGPRPRG